MKKRLAKKIVANMSRAAYPVRKVATALRKVGVKDSAKILLKYTMFYYMLRNDCMLMRLLFPGASRQR